ncbi:ketopantoate reductase family protein [Bosea sp. NPDC003192]|uniref:ketopantoate reductase family protein n=1 Tax=Bosea sp. NPDC003192 TaxID=3390551 RepID=UPI003D054D98
MSEHRPGSTASLDALPPQRIAIVGAGALGSFVGARLSRAGYDTTLIDNDTARVRAIDSAGLRLENDRETLDIAIPAHLAADLTEPFDLLVILTKAAHTEAAIASCRHLLGPGTHLLTFQNGLGNAAVLARHVDPDRIIVGMTNWAVDLLGPAHVRCIGDGEIRIWHVSGRDEPIVHAIAHLLDAGALNCAADPEVESAIWEKVAFNAAMNSISAVTGLTVGEIGDDVNGRSLAYAIASEVARVAEAKGLKADLRRVSAMLDHAFASHRAHKPSMLQDILAGRPTEIETINGAVVAEAARLGREVPITETLLKLVRMRDRTAHKD